MHTVKRMRKGALIVALAAGLPAANLVLATPNNWTGGGDGVHWSDGGNWSAGEPAAGHAVTVAAGSMLLTNETFELASFTMTGGTLTFTNWMTQLRATEISLEGDSILTLPPAFTDTQESNRVWIVCSNLTLAANAKIDADGRGYAAQQGEGKAGDNLAGGGHGGRGSPGASVDGWSAAGKTYGNVEAPMAPGSGGGDSRGGGAVWIEATGTVAIHGTISADGSNHDANQRGGGSGGSILIDCNIFTGSSDGWLRARGGNGHQAWFGGPGGGGRIAVRYDPSKQAQLDEPNPGVKFSIGPGTLADRPELAEAGTLYLPEMDRLFLSGTLSTQWDILNAHTPDFSTWELDALTVNGRISLPDLRELIVTNNLSIHAGGSLALFSGPTNAVSADYGFLLNTGGELLAAGTLYLRCDPTNGATPRVLADSLTVADGGEINADCGGYRRQYTPAGKLPDPDRGGGGHGGRGSPGPTGWHAQGPIFGDPLDPRLPGSGGRDDGGGAYGGGLVDIVVIRDVTIHGTISANGGHGLARGAGGAGGAVRIECQRLLGSASGTIRVQGGNGYATGAWTHGGGGGGRIVVLYDPLEQSKLAESNPGVAFSAAPGTEADRSWLAEAGTVYLPDMETLFLSETLSAQWYKINAWLPDLTTWEVDSLTIAGKIAFPFLRELAVSEDLTIAEHGVLTLRSGPDELADPLIGMRLKIGKQLTVAGTLELHSDLDAGLSPYIECGNATVSDTGVILADYRGFDTEQGDGAGKNRGGAGYGGPGGRGFSVDSDLPGGEYGWAHAPVFPGSGGGNYTANFGGRGGGAIRINARHAITLYGTLSANGMDGVGQHGGGAGSGGSILLTAQRIQVTDAVLRAEGGKATHNWGGNAGGGRIALLTPYMSPSQIVRLASGPKPNALIEFDPADLDGFSGTLAVKGGDRAGSPEDGEEGSIFFGSLVTGTIIVIR